MLKFENNLHSNSKLIALSEWSLGDTSSQFNISSGNLHGAFPRNEEFLLELLTHVRHSFVISCAAHIELAGAKMSGESAAASKSRRLGQAEIDDAIRRMTRQGPSAASTPQEGRQAGRQAQAVIRAGRGRAGASPMLARLLARLQKAAARFSCAQMANGPPSTVRRERESIDQRPHRGLFISRLQCKRRRRKIMTRVSSPPGTTN